MKLLLSILFPILTFAQTGTTPIDLTNDLSNITDGWSIGNACGEDFRLNSFYNGNLDMKNEPLEILNSHFTVYGNIINQGEIIYLCDDAVLEITGEVLGVEKPKKEEIKIFPIPAVNEINIKGIEVSDLALFDMSGRKLKHFQTFGNLHKIIIDDLEAGVYVLIVNKTITKKIIKL